MLSADVTAAPYHSTPLLCNTYNGVADNYYIAITYVNYILVNLLLTCSKAEKEALQHSVKAMQEALIRWDIGIERSQI